MKILHAQSVFAPLNNDYYWLIDRYEIKSGKFYPELFTTFKGIERKYIASLADSAQKLQNLSAADEFNLRYLQKDNWDYFADSNAVGASSLRYSKKFFTRHNAVVSKQLPNFTFILNPVAHFEQNTINRDYWLSLNTRGIEARGMIGKKIGFYTYITDNQTFVPDYVKAYTDSAGAFPGEGFTKPFKQRLKPGNMEGYDFFSARGYISFNPIKEINLQFGHDKNFIGNGYRSLMLSDASSKYLFLKSTTRVWHLQYTNLFTEMTGQVVNNNLYNPRKYMAMHHLSWNISRNFNIGLFEAISFFRGDSATGYRGFELNYLNPIIFYREVESFLGGQDKTAVGIDYKWNFFNRFSAYGQFVLNEFKISEIVRQNGWWANKYAWQIGLKYIDVLGIKNFDVQAEHNFIRPYMYTDKNVLSNFSNYGQPIAHPLGANLYEFIGIARYQPMPRLSVWCKGFYIMQGKDNPGTNWGGNIMKPGYQPMQEYNNAVGQGIKTTTLLAIINISYQLFHNLFLEARYMWRNEQSNLLNNTDGYATIGIRWNNAPRLHTF